MMNGVERFSLDESDPSDALTVARAVDQTLSLFALVLFALVIWRLARARWHARETRVAARPGE